MLRALLVLLAIATEAHAGYCLSEEERADETKKLELFARAPSKVEPNELPMLRCVTRGSAYATPKTATAYEKRALAACTKIAAMTSRESRVATTIDECSDFVVAHGVTTAGKTDLVAKLMTRPAGPLDVAPFEALAGSGDPRVHAFIIDKLEAALAKVGSRKLLGWKRDAWRDYRIAALHALQKVGTKDDVALVDNVLASAGNERRVVEAGNAAREVFR